MPALGGLGLCAAGAFWLGKAPRSEAVAVSKVNAATAATVTLPPAFAGPPLAGIATPGIRILCSRREPHSDRRGRLWSADEYFEGGNYWEQSRGYLARTFDPSLFQGSRTGNFSYQIPSMKRATRQENSTANGSGVCGAEANPTFPAKIHKMGGGRSPRRFVAAVCATEDL